MSAIALCDDDSQLTALLRDWFAAQGLSLDVYARAEDLLAADPARYDLLLLDVGLPGMDGFAALAALRAQVDTPVLMLTARGDDEDRIRGLEGGADDYLPKPFNPRELLARVRALLRRSGSHGGSSGGGGSAAAPAPRPGLLIDPARRLARLDGQDLELTGSEFALLQRLAAQAGEPVSRDTLYRDALQRRWNPLDRALDQHIVGLRRKLGAQAVATVRGRGYQLTLPLAAPPHPRAER